jgi:CspA family cold shock protein
VYCQGEPGHDESVAIPGVVRTWHDEHGWGVVDSAETPGGCFVLWAMVAVAGFQALAPGQAVELEYEAGEQDGYAYRAVRVWPRGQEPQPFPSPSTEPSSAYRSTLTITFDDE